jgi:HicB-like protein involved in pilus formation
MAPTWCHYGAMDLTPHVENLRRELAVAAEAGGQEARALAERLTAPLESAVRLTLLEALSAAADEITRELAPGSVELRLRGGEPGFVATPAPTDEPLEPAADVPPAPDAEDGATARINLRLPEQLKAGIEQAASRERLSVNAWVVRVTAAAVVHEDRDRRPSQRGGGRAGQAYTGWVR